MGESVFLGTGAAELYPNPFCGCKVCARARAVQKAPGILGNELRLRSAFLLDPETLIDFGPDVPAGSQHYHAPLDRVRQVLVTHSHEDRYESAYPFLHFLSRPGLGGPACNRDRPYFRNFWQYFGNAEGTGEDCPLSGGSLQNL